MTNAYNVFNDNYWVLFTSGVISVNIEVKIIEELHLKASKFKKINGNQMETKYLFIRTFECANHR